MHPEVFAGKSDAQVGREMDQQALLLTRLPTSPIEMGPNVCLARREGITAEKR
jgi:hypothetical protein